MSQVNARYPGPGRIGWNGRGGSSPTLPPAPVLTWSSGTTVNPPTFIIDFDDAHVWPSGSIDVNNFDRMELQIDDDPLFGGVDEDVTDDLDAAEIAAGLVSPSIGSQPTGIALYARARHIHYVGGVAHTSGWSNTETKTLVADKWLLEDGTGNWQLENSTGSWRLEL